MVERLTVNQDVAGSSPAVAANAFPIYFNIKKTGSDKVTVNLSLPSWSYYLFVVRGISNAGA